MDYREGDGAVAEADRGKKSNLRDEAEQTDTGGNYNSKSIQEPSPVETRWNKHDPNLTTERARQRLNFERRHI